MLSLSVGLFGSAVRANPGPPAGDTTPPARVTDFAPIGSSPGESLIGWTAAGDDGFSGMALTYDIRWSAAGFINDANWDSATSVFGGWWPNAAPGGDPVDRLVTDPGAVPVWYAVRYRDEAGNMGQTSNNVLIADWLY